MKRAYEEVLEEHLHNYRQMLFLTGPRQVGKTTTSLKASFHATNHFYFNWDNEVDRALIINGSQAIAEAVQLNQVQENLPIIIFDEIHKYPHWKLFLKGFFDVYEKKARIIVIGSARLDIYKKGGDSMMGRYFLYRLHPLSVREIADPSLKLEEIQNPVKISQEDYDALFTYGGFPEPFLKRNKSFWNRWKRLRLAQLFKEDIRDLSRIQELSQIQLLVEILSLQAGQLVNYSALAAKVRAANTTVQRWMEVLKNLYYCFTLQPWSKNVSRSLLKEPKVYLWNWAFVEEQGARYENFVASHLLKAVHFWTDRGLGEYDLYFLRDKDQREVDFLVTKNSTPWFLVEVKSSLNKGISKSLHHFQQQTQAPHAFQVVFELPYVNRNCFEEKSPIIVPASTFLSQLA